MQFKETPVDGLMVVETALHSDERGFFGRTFCEVEIKDAGVDSIRLYLSGANLLTFTDYDGLDPEVAGNNALTIGVDEGTYPLPQITTVGLNINF